jgi:hypothetical protein
LPGRNNPVMSCGPVWQNTTMNIQVAMLALILACPCAIAQSGVAAEPRNLQVMRAEAPPPSQVAQSRQRLALVIGNASYREAPLANPVNDARAVAQALRESGFTVMLRENTDQRGMQSALREFGDRLRAGGTGLFYFAGHGMQIKGRNYLIPVGVGIEREDEVAYNAVDAQAVLDKMEAAGNGANIMILDACRNNPFIRSGRSGQQGLAQMDAPVGTLVAYATSPGAVASDGNGANGLYTHHLLRAIQQPNNKVEDVFKQVRTGVRRDSGGAQVPWESTSMEGDFYFIGGPAQPTAAQADALESLLWDAVKDGRFAAEARMRLSDLAASGAVQVTGVAGTTPPSPVALRPASERVSALASNESGFAVGDRWRFQVVDKFRGEVVRNYSNTIEGIFPDGTMSLNGGRVRWDSKGNVLSDSSMETEDTYTGYVFVPPVLQEGAKTSLNYSVRRKVPGPGQAQATDEGKGTMTVRRREKVVTPGGEFNAWRVELEIYGYTRKGQNENVFGSQQMGDGAWRKDVTAWYVPELRNYVAYEEQIRISSGYQSASTGGFTRRERHELTSFSVKGAENVARR